MKATPWMNSTPEQLGLNRYADSDAEAGSSLSHRYESRCGHDAERNGGETASADPGVQAVPDVARANKDTGRHSDGQRRRGRRSRD